MDGASSQRQCRGISGRPFVGCNASLASVLIEEHSVGGLVQGCSALKRLLGGGMELGFGYIICTLYQ